MLLESTSSINVALVLWSTTEVLLYYSTVVHSQRRTPVVVYRSGRSEVNVLRRRLSSTKGKSLLQK
jgi:hypothetical protein